jgi:drug/metabolite transporter (DMT)-like permease
MIFIIALIGGFLGRFLIGGILNFIFKPNEHHNPNPENYLGWIGAILGVILSFLIYKI